MFKRKLKVYLLALVLPLGLILGMLWNFSQDNASVLFPVPLIKQERGKMEANSLYIPSLDVLAPVIYPNEASEQVFQKALQEGVVHFPGTAYPGQLGNVYIFGHSSDNVWAKGDYKTIFAKLPELKAGQLIFISDQEGNRFIYKILETKIVSPKETSVLGQYNFEKHILTLQTSYPIGGSRERFIVIAELE